MGSKKTESEKIKELEEKIAQMKAQKQKLENRQKEKERKARTKRLIQIGALAEKYIAKGQIWTPEVWEIRLQHLMEELEENQGGPDTAHEQNQAPDTGHIKTQAPAIGAFSAADQ